MATYSLSGRWRPYQKQGVYGDFVNLKISQPSHSEVLRGVEYVFVCL